MSTHPKLRPLIRQDTTHVRKDTTQLRRKPFKQKSNNLNSSCNTRINFNFDLQFSIQINEMMRNDFEVKTIQITNIIFHICKLQNK